MKAYINPQTIALPIELECSLMAGSGDVPGVGEGKEQGSTKPQFVQHR